MGRVLLALAHFDPGGELHHGFRLVFADGGPHGFGVADVAFNQRPPAHGVFVSRGEIVEHNRLVPGHAHGFCSVGADIAGAADDQDAFEGHVPASC